MANESNTKERFFVAEMFLEFLSIIALILLILGLIFLFLVVLRKDDIIADSGNFEYTKQLMIGIFLIISSISTSLFIIRNNKKMQKAKTK